jgi:hypothetical protein
VHVAGVFRPVVSSRVGVGQRWAGQVPYILARDVQAASCMLSRDGRARSMLARDEWHSQCFGAGSGSGWIRIQFGPGSEIWTHIQNQDRDSGSRCLKIGLTHKIIIS